jgi:hypothetical protein
MIMREEHRLKAFQNRVLRRISGPKRDEVMEGWRKLHILELAKCNKNDQVDGEMGRACNTYGKKSAFAGKA